MIIAGVWLVAWFRGYAPRWPAGGTITVKTNAALALFLAGSALLLLGPGGARGPRRWAGAIASALALLIGALTLGEHLFRWNLGIDQLLAVEPQGGVATVSPNRMGPPASVSFVLIGLGLLALARGRRWPRAVAAYLGLATCLISLVPAVGYLFSIDTFYGNANLTGIAWPTVVALLSLGIGLVLAPRDVGPMAVLLRQDAGGALLRRFLPWAFLVPLVLGFLRVQGERAGLFDRATGRGMLIISVVLFSTVLLWRSAARLSRSAAAQRMADEQLRESEERLRRAQEVAHVGTFEWNLQTGVATWTPELEAMHGLPRGGFAKTQPAWERLVHPDDRAEVVRRVEQSFATGAPTEGEWRLVWPDGSVHWVAGRWQVIKDELGKPLRMTGINIDITERKWSDEELERAQQHLAADHAGLERLHELSSRLISHEELPALLQAVIDAAVDLTHAQKGTLQLFDETSKTLRIVSHRGFQKPFLDHFSVVHEGPAVCGEALRRRARVLVEDVSKSPIFLGTPTMAVMEAAGVRAVQSTLLVARDGALLGMFSTHWTEPHRPEEGTLRLLDLLAREAGSLIENYQRAEALRESEERLRLAQQVAHVGSFEWNIQTGLNTWSAELEAMYGLPTGGFANTQPAWEQLVHPEDREGAIRLVEKALATGQPVEGDWRVVWSDGSVHWLAGRFQASKDPAGNPLRLTGVNIDITERKRAEEELLEADRRKNEFLAVLSHELRNPLAPIRNSTFILERAAPGGDQAKRALGVIDRQAGQLARLVDDLLDVTRISRNKIQLQRQTLELNELVRRTMEDQRSLFEKAQVHLELQPAPRPVFVNADWNRLAQVLGNLLQNAAKFTGRGGKTRITLGTDTARKRAVIRVEDTGVGMAPEMVARLFQPFSQADSTLDRSKGGLGLGLALAKGLVDLHGGEVTAHSAGPGQGAEFVVRLPLAMEEIAMPQLGERAASGRRRVLIIEDNIDAADSLRDVLELGEHEVAVTYDGPQGIAKARECRPEVVLCDIGLPGIDGYEVARAFRADQALKGTYLVALSGYALPEDLQRAQDAGFDRHVAKPPSLEQLEQILAKVPPFSTRAPAAPSPQPDQTP